VRHGCGKSLPSRYSNTEIRPASNRRILLIEQVWPSATSEVLFDIRVLYERQERSMGSSNTGAAAVSWMVTLFTTALCCSRACAEDTPELAKLVQNPIARVISLPFQNNLTFGVGPDHDPQNVLNIQPVLPLRSTMTGMSSHALVKRSGGMLRATAKLSSMCGKG
jgi:hypothetical protein